MATDHSPHCPSEQEGGVRPHHSICLELPWSTEGGRSDPGPVLELDLKRPPPRPLGSQLPCKQQRAHPGRGTEASGLGLGGGLASSGLLQPQWSRAEPPSPGPARIPDLHDLEALPEGLLNFQEASYMLTDRQNSSAFLLTGEF